MKTDEEKIEDKESIEVLDGLVDLMENELGESYKKVEEAYNDSVFKFTSIFVGIDKSPEDCAEYAAMVIDQADANISSILMEYAMDDNNYDYRMPSEYMNKAKKYLMDILYRNKNGDEVFDKLFKSLFCMFYAIPIKNATKYRINVLADSKHHESEMPRNK